MAARPRNLPALLGAVLLLTLGSAAALEGISRASIAIDLIPDDELRLQGPLVIRPHPFLAFCLREGGVRGAGTPVEQRINPQGYRGRPVGPKTTNTLRVICLGDSVVYGDSLGEAETMPAQLERELTAKVPNKTVEVVNAGVLQYTSAESFAAFLLRGIDLAPDFVVIYEGANDVAPRLVRPFRADYSQYRAVWDTDPNDASDRWLEASAGYLAVRWIAGVFPAAQHLDWYTIRPFPKASPEERELAFMRSSSEPLVHNERIVMAVARARGARTLLVAPAYNRDFEGARSFIGRAFDEARPRQERTASLQAGGFLDLSQKLDSKVHFRDPVHFTPAGARFVAARIADEMDRLGWLPK